MYPNVLRIAVAASLTVGPRGIDASAQAQEVASEVEGYLAAYAASGLSSGAVLLARGDSVVFAGGFGYADVDARIPNRVDTRFRIGSLTKSMTWAAIQGLAERGLLDLDDPVANVIGTPALAADVTVRRLLGHEGGVADWSTLPDPPQSGTRAPGLAELAEWIASQDLIFPPGTNRRYSNPGYVLLARIIEVVSGSAYGDFLSEELFRPLQMRNTLHAVEHAPARLAVGYTQGHHPEPMVRVDIGQPSMFTGSGSVISTVEDLFVWSRSAAARQFPWDRRRQHGRTVSIMGGFVPGFGAWIERYENEDLTVLVLTNLNNGAIQQLVADLGAILLLGESVEPPPAHRDEVVGSEGRAAFAGSWVCDGGPEFTIRPAPGDAGDRLEILWRHRGPSQPLWVQSDSAVFYPQDWAIISAFRDARSGVSYKSWGSEAVSCHLRD